MALNPDVIIIPLLWGVSSAGRALRWQRRGHGFDPRTLHQIKNPCRYDKGSSYFRLFSEDYSSSASSRMFLDMTVTGLS